MEERVQKIIAQSGICARRQAEELINAGFVKVNGKTIHIGDKADPNKDSITVKDKLIKPLKKKYFAFHKPKKLTITMSDPLEENILADYIPLKEKVFPVGRLDKNATGLLILTNDGELANKIMHPRYEITKTYRIITKTSIHPKDIKILRSGIRIDGRLVTCKIWERGESCIDLEIHEGRHKIVKRLLGKLGYWIKSLKRVKLGNLNLDKLRIQEGEIIALTDSDINKIFEKRNRSS